MDNPRAKVRVVGAFNQWGSQGHADSAELRQVADTPYFEGTIRGIRHGMEYRLEVDGKQLLDPGATTFTSGGFLNSVFWDKNHPAAYRATAPVPDLRGRSPIIGETELYELVRHWKGGPKKVEDTYRFIAESGVIEELAAMGYNAIEFLPFAPAVEGEGWPLRYQAYGNFGPDAKYGTPDEFRRMVDTFNRKKIAVIMDLVASHYPFRGNDGVRALGPVGIHNWMNREGKALFGDPMSPWGTYRYDYANPHVRRFLIDGALTMLRDYGVGGIRFDNLEGIRGMPGGDVFLKELVAEIRKYRPEAILGAENFQDHLPVQTRQDWAGIGMNFTSQSEHFYHWFRDQAQKRTEEVDMNVIRDALRHPMWWGDLSRISYITTHDEAANKTHGATGAYPATLLKGGNDSWPYVVGKVRAFSAIAMLSGSAYMDMPQARLLQEGDFNKSPGVRWDLTQHQSQRQHRDFMSAMSNAVKDNPAFGFQNFHPDIENHVDNNNKVISLKRIDYATGKVYYAVISLNHEAKVNYNFGVDGGGNLRLLVNSDRTEFGGTNKLAEAMPSGVLKADGSPNHGKSGSLTLPYLPAYGVLIFEAQK